MSYVYSADNTISLSVSQDSPHMEAKAGEDISPGTLLLFDGPAKITTIVYPHDIDDGVAEPIFATENIYTGGEVDDLYFAGDRVIARYARPGDLIYAWFGDVGTVEASDFLVSNGDGSLRVKTLGSTGIIAKAVEGLGPGHLTPTRLAVRII